MKDPMISEEQAVQNVAANLERLLEARDMTQRDLARAVGVYDSVISQIIYGRHVVRYTLLAQIAEVLDVSMDRMIAAPPEKILEKIG
jgi:transcriptional regulator with XRE-family HTH domain